MSPLHCNAGDNNPAMCNIFNERRRLASSTTLLTNIRSTPNRQADRLASALKDVKANDVVSLSTLSLQMNRPLQLKPADSENRGGKCSPNYLVLGTTYHLPNQRHQAFAHFLGQLSTGLIIIMGEAHLCTNYEQFKQFIPSPLLLLLLMSMMSPSSRPLCLIPSLGRAGLFLLHSSSSDVN